MVEMSQTFITGYFSKRKRKGDEIRTQKKVLVLDHLDFESDVSVSKEVCVNHKVSGACTSEALPSVYKNKTIVEDVSKDFPNQLIRECTSHVQCKTQGKASGKHYAQKSSQRRCKRTTGIYSKAVAQSTIRQILFKTNGAEGLDEVQPVNGVSPTTKQTSSEDATVVGPDCSALKESSAPKETGSPSIQGPVIFELKGCLSPEKKMKAGLITNDKFVGDEVTDTQDSCIENSCDGKINESRKELGLMTPHKMPVNQPKDLAFEELKKKLARSDRLRQSLSRFDKSAAKLKAIEEKRQKLEIPQLKKFQAIDIEVQTSPQKNIFSSPQKVGTSPQSTPTKLPAYQLFSSLALPGSPVLSLPYGYRCLTEIFRCVDAVVSMLYKRKELITFRKLKPAVQEMLRRNFTEHHLAQIKRVYPAAYVYRQEKCRNFGSTSKADQYELTLTPTLNLNVQGNENSIDHIRFTSDCLLERRQNFHRNLLERVKDYHEDFLQSLDPPLKIPRDQLTRWHPEFALDQVPDIEPDTLPEAPNVEKYYSARDVLEKSRNLFSCNLRMEKALQTVSESSQSEVPTTPTKSLHNISDTASSSPISALLTGIPKALLEKIRAKQAAKALQAMTQSPAQHRVATQYMRLPELARILRNLFVTEKKSILPLDFTLEKLGNSYREKLPRVELEEHIQLLKKSVPGWLETHYIRKTNYLKLSKNADMGPVIRKLEALAAKTCER